MLDLFSLFIFLSPNSSYSAKSSIFSDFIKNGYAIEYSKFQEKTVHESKKIPSFNYRSGKTVLINENAVDKSKNLTLITETPAPSPSKAPEVSVSPFPTVIATITPLPTYIPITETPNPPLPTKCPSQVCLMIACTDYVQKGVSKPEIVPNDCHCPCVPPPIY